jgi:hypothetical protein
MGTGEGGEEERLIFVGKSSMHRPLPICSTRFLRRLHGNGTGESTARYNLQNDRLSRFEPLTSAVTAYGPGVPV